jgi:hypothetical protein
MYTSIRTSCTNLAYRREAAAAVGATINQNGRPEEVRLAIFSG